MNESVVLSLIDNVYAAAERPELWPLFLENLSGVLDSKMTVLMHQDARNRSAEVGTAVRIDPASVKLYHDEYASRNIFFLDRRTPLLSGMLMSETDVDERTLLTSDYYGGYLEPHDVRYVGGLILSNDDGIISMLSTMRSKRKGEFTENHFSLLRTLRPHLQRALNLHRMLCTAEDRATLREEALHLVSGGVVLLDRAGHVTFMNRSAEGMTRSADGLRVADGVLRPMSTDTCRKLLALVAGAAQTASATSLAGGGTLLIERPSGKRPYTVVVTPLRARHTIDGSQPAVAVLITDPDSCARIAPERLRDLFGLTGAEARVAEQLVHGARISEVAHALDVGTATVKSHLKRIFAKTGVRRQAELIALFSAIRGG